MPRNRQQTACRTAPDRRKVGQPHPTPVRASTGPQPLPFAGRILKDFERWESMTEAERKAYDLGRDAGRSEATPVVLPPGADTLGRRVRIPKLTLPNMPRYIGAVSKALERGEVTAQDARAMLYAAQMLLATWNALGDVLPKEPPATRIGFIQAAAERLEISMKIVKRNPYASTAPTTGPKTARPAAPKIISKPGNGGKRTKDGKAAA